MLGRYITIPGFKQWDRFTQEDWAWLVVPVHSVLPTCRPMNSSERAKKERKKNIVKSSGIISEFYPSMEDEEGDRLNKKDLLNKQRQEQWAASRDYRNKRRRDNRLKKLQNEYTDNFARYRQQIISERSEGISIRTCNHNDDCK
ncbi:Uncharacterized protein Fot_15763 [Forsythia ovata]|uniref:BZIP domain-containing protein n=1 Tax=Forsythia ovata TaxID=205694 RepID=A0ABD1WDS8_9LAMI